MGVLIHRFHQCLFNIWEARQRRLMKHLTQKQQKYLKKFCTPYTAYRVIPSTILLLVLYFGYHYSDGNEEVIILKFLTLFRYITFDVVGVCLFYFILAVIRQEETYFLTKYLWLISFTFSMSLCTLFYYIREDYDEAAVLDSRVFKRLPRSINELMNGYIWIFLAIDGFITERRGGNIFLLGFYVTSITAAYVIVVEIVIHLHKIYPYEAMIKTDLIVRLKFYAIWLAMSLICMAAIVLCNTLVHFNFLQRMKSKKKDPQVEAANTGEDANPTPPKKKIRYLPEAELKADEDDYSCPEEKVNHEVTMKTNLEPARQWGVSQAGNYFGTVLTSPKSVLQRHGSFAPELSRRTYYSPKIWVPKPVLNRSHSTYRLSESSTNLTHQPASHRDILQSGNYFGTVLTSPKSVLQRHGSFVPVKSRYITVEKKTLPN